MDYTPRSPSKDMSFPSKKCKTDGIQSLIDDGLSTDPNPSHSYTKDYLPVNAYT